MKYPVNLNEDQENAYLRFLLLKLLESLKDEIVWYNYWDCGADSISCRCCGREVEQIRENGRYGALPEIKDFPHREDCIYVEVLKVIN